MALPHSQSRRLHHRRSSVYVYLVALKAIQEFFSQPYTPPVTLGLIGLMTVLHLRPGTLDYTLPSISQVCLNPALVVETHSLRRLVLSALFHADDAHLIFNSVSFLWKGLQLERSLGSARFAALIAALTLASQSLLIVTSRVLSDVLDLHGPYYNDCVVGFSGVLFALKTILDFSSPTYSLVGGVRVPTRLAAWAELLAIQLVVPHASFVGHLSGILAGLLFLHAPSLLPALSLLPVLPRGGTWPAWLRSPLRLRLRLPSIPFISAAAPTWGSGRSGHRGAAAAAAAAAPRSTAAHTPTPSPPHVPPPESAPIGTTPGGSGSGSGSSGAEGHGRGPGGPTWCCGRCTYDNPPSEAHCVMCEGQRSGGEGIAAGDGETQPGRAREPDTGSTGRHDVNGVVGSAGGSDAASGSPSLEELRARRLSRFQGT